MFRLPVGACAGEPVSGLESTITTLRIPAVPPSLNKVLRMHWAKQGKLHSDWRWLVMGALNQMGAMYLKPIVKMRVKITLCHSRFYDKDNAYGACKTLVDGLRHWSLIVNDTPEFLDLTVEQEKCPHKQRHTIVELEAA